MKRFLKFIRKKILGVPFLEQLGRPVYKVLVSNPEMKKTKAVFKRNGLRIIKEFDIVLRDNGFRYYLYFGTLLGAIREHGLIKHDFDFDVAMLSTDYSDNLRLVLENAGFKLKYEVLVDEGRSSRHQSYEKDGISIDIFWIYPPVDKLMYCCGTSLPLDGAKNLYDSIKKFGGTQPVRIELPFNPSVRYVEFEDLMLPVPLNAEENLEVCYGKDFMIPNPDWKEPRNIPYKVIWRGKIGVVKQY